MCDRGIAAAITRAFKKARSRTRQKARPIASLLQRRFPRPWSVEEIGLALAWSSVTTAARGSPTSSMPLSCGVDNDIRFNLIGDAIQAKNDHIPDQHNCHHSRDGEPK